jgi:hypothetical protein
VEGAARSAGVRTGDSLVAYAGTGVPPNVSVLDIVQVRKGLDIVQVRKGLDIVQVAGGVAQGNGLRRSGKRGLSPPKRGLSPPESRPSKHPAAAAARGVC